MDKTGKGVKRATESSYEITFMYKGIRCRERVKAKPSVSNDIAVTRFRAAVEQAIIDGVFDYEQSFPNSKRSKQFRSSKRYNRLDHYLINWWEEKKQQHKASTADHYNKVIHNILIPSLGHLDIQDLTRYHVKQMIKKWEVQKKTINTRVSVLRKALSDAQDDGLINLNILYGWNFTPRIEKPKERDPITPFSKDEMQTLLNHLKGSELNVFQTFFFTGLRPSELVCLTWDDVRLKDLVINITKSQTDKAKNPEIAKTKESKRQIKILAPALEALKNQRAITGFKKGLVFENPRTESKWTTGRLYKIFSKRLKECGIDHHKLEQTRHTYASMMLSAGESIMWVAQQMGHSDWVLLSKIYGKWIPDANPEAGNKALEKFWRK